MNKIRPIIKWTGGKFNEFSLFGSEIPKFDRYIEPFFGGGGVFFALQPKVKALINDKSEDLINFYKLVGNESLQHELNTYADAWDQLTDIYFNLWKLIKQYYFAYLDHKTNLEDLVDSLENHLTECLKDFPLFNESSFIIDYEAFKRKLISSMADKAKRIKNITTREGRKFDENELGVHFETGIRSGVYLFFRSILNAQHHQQTLLTREKAAANWYFVRELCYGSMFRFNSKGDFNIPYGGITYNKKKLRQKILNIFSAPIVDLFRQTTIFNLDFEMFLSQVHLMSTDFIFLDPPYDSEFSEYDQNAFTQKDQLRLANFLIKTPAKWMVVIKETPFIREIYNHKSIKIKVFLKNYTYNMRGRNKRAVQHLIITNY